MEDGNQEQEQQKKKRLNSSKLRKKNRDRLKLSGTIGSSADYNPRKIPPKYGVLRCRPQNNSHLLMVFPSSRKHGFRSFVDLENIKSDVEEAANQGITFDVFRITQIATSFMKWKYPGKNFFVLDTTIVGCWEFYFGNKGYTVPNFDDLKRDHCFEYVHVHARERFCCKCGRLYLRAHSKRNTVKYERKADIADSIIEDLVYDAARFFGRPLNVLLITGDADFVELVEALRVEGIKVYLGMPNNCAQRLKHAVKQDQRFPLWDLITFKSS